MNSRQWFSVSGSIFSAVLSILAGSASLAAQQSQAITGKTPFVVAPSLPLAGLPVGLAVGDLNGDGKLDLITADWTSGKVTVSLGLGNGRFATGSDYAAGSHPAALVLADVDGDGRMDVVVANASEGTVSVLLGSGNGQLQQPHAYKSGIHPTLLSVGDFNATGRADLIAVDAVANRFALLLNDGKGGFASPALHGLSHTPAAITVADLNHDGHADLALSNTDGSISIFWGNQGDFQTGPVTHVASGALSSVLAADFNHDGILDLAVTIPGEKQLAILTGKGDGSFAAPATYRVGGNPVSIVAGDVDEDGIADLIVTNQGSNTFSVLGGNGDGTFRSAVDFVAGKGPVVALAGDFDKDGHLDLAILNRDGQSLSLPLGNGDGTFRAARAFNVELQPRSIAVGDLNGDKKSDLVVTNYCGSDTSCLKGGTVSVLVAGENGSYHLTTSYALGAEPVAVALVDLDGDSNLDIVALNRADKTISVLLGLSAGSFQQQFTLPLANAPIAFAIGDFNGDGKTDLAVIGDCGAAKCVQPGTLEILYGSADGNFRGGPSYPVGFSPVSVAVADLDGDKHPDVVVANRCGSSAACTGVGTASVFQGSSAGKLSAAKTLALGKSPSSISLADLSGRGTADLIITSSTDNTVELMRGNGDGSFAKAVQYAVGNAPGSIAVADFNGDGKLDIAVGNVSDSTVSILYGKGDGTLLAGPITSVGPGPAAIAPLFNTAGRHAGLVTANANSAAAMNGSDVTVLANIQPDVTGTQQSTITVSANPTSATVNDAVTLTAVVTGDEEDDAPSGGQVTFTSSPDTIMDCNGTTSNVVATSSSTSGFTTTFTCVTHSLQGGMQQVSAGYSGDAVYAASSTTNPPTVTVSPYVLTMGITSSVATTPVNGGVTFTATLTGIPTSPAVAPSGKIHFLVNGAADASECPDASGPSASCTTNKLTVGNGVVSATYIDDSNYTALAAMKTVTVTPITATLTVSTPLTTTPVNGSVTFTATFTASSETPTAPSGSISFAINGSPSTDCPDKPISTPPYTCTTSSLSVSKGGTVTASYAGDTNFVATAVSKTITVTPIAAKVTLSALGSTPTVNQSVTFNAGVTASSTSPTAPTGSVAFTVNGKATGCAGTLNSSGQASCTTTALIAPSDTVTATYGGDSNFTTIADTTGTSTQTPTVNPISANLVLNMPTTGTVAKSVNITVSLPATVALTPTKPSASVAFTVNGATPTAGTPLYECLNQPFTSGTMSCTTSFSSANSYEIVASYPGYPTSDPNFNLGVALQAIQIGQAAGLTLKLTAGSATGTVNQPVQYSLALTPPSGGSAPTGSVTFKDTTTNATLPCSPVQLSGSGTTAVCAQTFGDTSDDSVVAIYSGNGSYPQQTSNAASIQVNPESTTTQITLATPNPSSLSQPVNFTATVSTASVSVTPLSGGTVTFVDTTTGATMCSKVSLTASGITGTANCSYAFPSSGAQQIKATFTPQSTTQFQTSAGTATQTVGSQDGTTTVVKLGGSSLNPSSVDQPVTFVANITPTYPGGASMSGHVTFKDALSQVTLCPSVAVTTTTANSDITGATASCTAPLTVAGIATITATFTDALNNYTSSAGSVVQTVNADSTTIAFAAPTTATSTVDQGVTLTAAISATPTYVSTNSTALQQPTGTVTFKDTTTGTTLCGGPLNVSTSPNSTGLITATCKTTVLDGRAHSISASYSGDSNFNTSATGGNTNAIVSINPANVTVTAAASGTPVATQLTTVVATVDTGVKQSSILPDGTVDFNFSNSGLVTPSACRGVSVQPGNDTNHSTVVASCQVAFAVSTDTTASTQIGVTAVYNPGSNPTNFTAASSTLTPIPVQNFQLTTSAQSKPVFVSQGSTNTGGPFTAAPFSATPIEITPQPINGFTDKIDLTCSVAPVAAPTGSTPSCGFGVSNPSQTGSFPRGSIAPLALTITSAAKDAPGEYTVTITGTDDVTQALVQSTSFTLNVVQVIGTLSVASGATTEADVDITVPQGVTLSNFQCVNIINTATNTPANDNGLTCTAGTQGAWNSGVIEVPITITAGASQSSGSVRAGALWAMPLVAVLLLLSGGRTRRRSLIRFLSLVLLAAGVSAGVGCGGSFTGPPPVTGTTPGNYAVEVTATGSDGNTYSAVVNIYVAATQ